MASERTKRRVKPQPKADKPKGPSRNEHTGAYMRTKEPSPKFLENFDKIDWSKK